MGNCVKCSLESARRAQSLGEREEGCAAARGRCPAGPLIVCCGAPTAAASSGHRRRPSPLFLKDQCSPTYVGKNPREQKKMICDQRTRWFGKDLGIRWEKVPVIKAHWDGRGKGGN